MTVEFEGIPYSDCFVVEIRWVARRDGDGIKVEVGVEVDFKKSTFLKSKIRSGTIEETSVVHKDLFQAIAKACAAAKGTPVDETKVPFDDVVVEEPEAGTAHAKGIVQLLSKYSFDHYTIAGCGALLFLVLLWRFLARNRVANVVGPPSSTAIDEVTVLESRIDNLEAELQAIHGTLKEILFVLKEAKNDGDA